ncbi:MAG: chrR [Alphaproteobacteria bacterium]|nr:chrR [Alphaproteobacteria bacterium]
MRHHPDDDILLAYASGVSDEATGLVIATHLAFCAQCRASVSLMETVGGGLLDALPPAPLAETAFAATMARLDSAPPFARPARTASRDGTPEPLRSYLGGDLSSVRWRRMGPRLAYLPLLRRGGTSAKLLRGSPGTEVGAHTHRGLELTLVLKGGFTDVTGNYGPGDLQVADGSLRHSPIADPGEDCINLAVTTDSLRFENWIQKIAGPIFGF